MFLTPEQLEDLTGLKQAAAQIRWLQKNGVEHYVRADGQVRVVPAALEPARGDTRSVTKPNFEVLRAHR